MTDEVDYRGGAAAAERLAGGAALPQALPVPGPRGWLALDVGARRYESYGSADPGWERVAPLPADLSTLDDGRLALALCHRNGFVREAALEAARGRPALLPLVVIRCADWVEAVRERARRLLAGALTAGHARDLAPLILLAARGERGGFAVGLLSEALRGADRDQWAAQLAAPDRATRRFAHRLALAEGRLSPLQLASTAARRAEDPVLQDLCATAALAALPDGPGAYGGEFDEVVESLLSARNPRCRAAGVTALRRAGRGDGAESFLADRSPLVRACARYVLKRTGADPAVRYREAVRTPDGLPGPPPGAVVGLAECGDPRDAALLWPLVAHPVPAVRARAVEGLRLLDRVDRERLRPLLDDPAPAVVREATASLLSCARDLPPGWLLDRVGPDRPRHVRLAALRLLAAGGGAQDLRAALVLVADADPKLRAVVERAAGLR
ncbi:hypothetical protein [Streptomyces sp. NPDC002490]|uniref:hypothetical protein n=1 Tax=Streptomyces sp. NPDC002490 TaxID=3154416 RepID=UPI0033338B75